MASSVPIMNDFPEVGGKVRASTGERKQQNKYTITVDKVNEGGEGNLNQICWYFHSITFICSIPLVLVEAGHAGPGLGGRWWLHVGQVLCVPQVSEHVLQFGPVWPYITSQVKSVNKQKREQWRVKKRNTKKINNAKYFICVNKLKKRRQSEHGRKAALKRKKVN